ncbi:hypothetical protein [Parapedobacter sp. DT-150]|uniref:hypothetical protein n=1 Tax=Parapedobacter sp. DT-150 TaxID=3396162 RepID=UPI003F1C71C0
MTMNTAPINRQPRNGERSFTNMLLALLACFRYLLCRWPVLGVCSLLGASAGMAGALLEGEEYVAELTFVLEEGRSSALGAYAGVASQLGLISDGGASNGVFEGDNVLKFLTSRLMVERALLSAVTLDGRERTLADWYIGASGLRERWSGDGRLEGVGFPAGIDRSAFTRLQDSVLQVLHYRLVARNLEITRPDRKLNFISVKCRSSDERFAKAFTERLVVQATDFYIATKTRRNRDNTERLQHQADSLKRLLKQKAHAAAATHDLLINPARRAASIGSEEVQLDRLILQTTYAEVVKNLEMSRMATAQEMPVIQVVDTPLLPLRTEKLGVLKAALVGGALAGSLAGAILLAGYGYRRLLGNNQTIA